MSDGFHTGGCHFTEDSFESYFEAVKKVMKPGVLFSDNYFEILRVPPIYRQRIIEYLWATYPQYKIETYEVSGIFIWGDLNAYIRNAIRNVARGIYVLRNIKEDYISRVLGALEKRYPQYIFDIRNVADVRSIVVNGHGP
jgi:hypothetical protein